MVDEQSDCQRQFQAAVSVIQALPKNGSYRPSHEKMLKFYCFYKQATVGPCNISRPGFWDPIGRIKWDAWKALGNMSKKEAMTNYIEEIKNAAGEVVNRMSGTENAEQHFHLFEPLYEVVEDMPRPPGLPLKKVPVTYKAKPGKMVRFQEDVGQDGASNNDIHSEDENLDPATEVFQLENTNELVGTLQPRERSDELQDATGSYWNGAVDVIDANHYTSDSESELFCDSVEELHHEKVLENHRSTVITKHSQDSPHSQDIEHPPAVHSVTLSNCRPAGHQPTAEGLLHCQPSCTSSNGERALVAGTRKKKKTEFASQFLGPKEKENGFHHSEGRCSQRLRNGLVNSVEDSKRIHGGKGAINLNDKIGLVLLNLQEDMQNVLQRLSQLEGMTTSQMKTTELEPPSLKTAKLKRACRWLFSPSRRTLIFLVLWPFVAQWIVHVLLRKRRS